MSLLNRGFNRFKKILGSLNQNVIDLEKSQYWPIEKLEAFQNKRLYHTPSFHIIKMIAFNFS